jgi:hypothetical protein
VSKEFHFGIYGPPDILTMEVENLITDKAKEYNGEWIGSGTAFDENRMERDICFVFYTNKYRKRFHKRMEEMFQTFPKDIVYFDLYVEDEKD